MKPLSKGDPVKVRLHNGAVVEAVYKEYNAQWGQHYLDFNGDELIVVRRRPLNYWECRFVGPACDLIPAGVSV